MDYKIPQVEVEEMAPGGSPLPSCASLIKMAKVHNIARQFGIGAADFNKFEKFMGRMNIVLAVRDLIATVQGEADYSGSAPWDEAKARFLARYRKHGDGSGVKLHSKPTPHHIGIYKFYLCLDQVQRRCYNEPPAQPEQLVGMYTEILRHYLDDDMDWQTLYSHDGNKMGESPLSPSQLVSSPLPSPMPGYGLSPRRYDGAGANGGVIQASSMKMLQAAEILKTDLNKYLQSGSRFDTKSALH